MSLNRSEIMCFNNIVMYRESAWDILNELGLHQALHFIDKYFNFFFKKIKKLLFL